jgi:glyoxylase-like metal-dependent hydrolase (beta-lactamase superfamily II)
MATALRGRGEQIETGVWRLRLPLPWPGIPHVNAWALERPDGIVLVDCGLDGPDSMAELERALGALNAGLMDVRLLVCTHAHPDHYGQAARIVERTGCELWMHPRHAHTTAALIDPEGVGRLRRAAALRSGVPEERLPSPSGSALESRGIAGAVEPDRELLDGLEVMTASRTWRVLETPGHAPSHVCLLDPDARLLLSGDHLLERVALHFDFGFSPDPVGEYLQSLDATESLDARRCLPGHGAPFDDIARAVVATRQEVLRRLDEVEDLLDRPMTAFEVATHRHGAAVLGSAGSLHLTETLALLGHLHIQGRVDRDRQGGVERWAIRSSN